MNRLRKFAPIALVLGAAATAHVILPHVPHDRAVELRLGTPASVTGVDVTWSEAGNAVQGGSWRFALGQAPRSIVSSVRLPSGRYDLRVVVDRPEGEAETRRAVTLDDADRVTVPIP